MAGTLAVTVAIAGCHLVELENKRVSLLLEYKLVYFGMSDMVHNVLNYGLLVKIAQNYLFRFFFPKKLYKIESFVIIFERKRGHCSYGTGHFSGFMRFYFIFLFCPRFYSACGAGWLLLYCHYLLFTI